MLRIPLRQISLKHEKLYEIFSVNLQLTSGSEIKFKSSSTSQEFIGHASALRKRGEIYGQSSN